MLTENIAYPLRISAFAQFLDSQGLHKTILRDDWNLSAVVIGKQFFLKLSLKFTLQTCLF